MDQNRATMRFQFSLRKLLIVIGLIGAMMGSIVFLVRWFTPRVCIQNKSPATLTNVVVSGNGFSQSLGTISAGAEVKASMSPHGDSGITVTFDANGQHYNSGNQEYIAGGPGERFTATVEVIHNDFQIHISRDPSTF
jgi:hypothetical protein